MPERSRQLPFMESFGGFAFRPLELDVKLAAHPGNDTHSDTCGARGGIEGKDSDCMVTLITTKRIADLDNGEGSSVTTMVDDVRNRQHWHNDVAVRTGSDALRSDIYTN